MTAVAERTAGRAVVRAGAVGAAGAAGAVGAVGTVRAEKESGPGEAAGAERARATERALQILADAARAVADAARGARDLPDDARTRLVAGIDAAVGRLTAARAEVLVAQRESGAWRRHGDPSFEAWRARTSRVGMRAAATEVRRGEALTSMPSVREAVEAGRVTVEHVDVVARTAATASEPVRQALASPEGQAELLHVATRVDAGKFARAVALWAAALDRSALERGHQAQRAARFLNLAETPNGTRITGQLDSVAGHRLRLALEGVAGKPAPDDERSPEQRRADALEALAGAAIGMTASGGVPVGPRATVAMVLREETWAALRNAARGRRGDGAGPRSDGSGRGEGENGGSEAGGAAGGPAGGGTKAGGASGGGGAKAGAANGGGPSAGGANGPTGHDGLRAVPPATIDDGVALPPSETARLLCDCELTRVVLDAQGQPMDLGRAVRLHTPSQRRAITARDGGCFWPGCGAPTRWCEVHHLVWWDRDGGATTVLDGALACSFHHHELHRLDLEVTRYTVPPTMCGPGESPTRYVVRTPGGRPLADGRPEDEAGRRIGTPARRWVPGRGAMEPDEAAGAEAREPDPPENPISGLGSRLNSQRPVTEPAAPTPAGAPRTRAPGHAPPVATSGRDSRTPTTSHAPPSPRVGRRDARAVWCTDLLAGLDQEPRAG